MTTRTIGAVIVMAAASAGAAPLQVPAAEVGSDAKLDIPAVPAFEVAAVPDGTHGVRELHAAGKRLLGQDVAASGYVIWIYDCVTELTRPGMARAKVQRQVDEDPTLCERKKLYLGDAKDTPRSDGLWVVDVPRPPNKLEKERLPKEEIKAWPAVPKLKVGDYVTITGAFAVVSPHSERNSDGLVVWKSFAPATPPAANAKRLALVEAKHEAPPALQPKRLVVPEPAQAVKDAAMRDLAEATRMYAAGDRANALVKYLGITKQWRGNHLAWYGAAGVQMADGKWGEAEQSMKTAFDLAPESAQYALAYAYSIYEGAFAAKQKTGAEMTPAVLDRSEQLLRYTIALEPKQWRAHYYLGRIARDEGLTHEAAEELTRAVSRAPANPGPWIALAELYRAWQLPELAVKVASAGAPLLNGAEAADLWYEAGMGYDAARDDASAIDAFGKALAARPDHAQALYGRGQIYYRKRDKAKAKADLEAFLKLPGNELAKQSASMMLMDLAAKK